MNGMWGVYTLFVMLYNVVAELQWVVEITFEKPSNLYLRLLQYRTRYTRQKYEIREETA
jgi:hypothetical protein